MAAADVDGFDWLRLATIAMPSGSKANDAFDALCNSVTEAVATKSVKSTGLQMIGTAYGDNDDDESVKEEEDGEAVDGVFDWERLLQDDGASIVPPNIYKKFMDAAAGSVADAPEVPLSSDSLTSSTSGEQERIRLISTALQKAVITEAVTSGAEIGAKMTIAGASGGGGGDGKNTSRRGRNKK